MSPQSTSTLANLNESEKEVALLLAAGKLVGSMVNRSALSLSGDDERVTIRPETMECRDLISILLVDFISPLRSPFNRQTSMLQSLVEICNNPHFDFDSSIAPLRQAVTTFAEWLDCEVTLESIWLPSIGKELSLNLKREDFLYICGNIAKHNIFRLNAVTERLLAVLQRSDPNAALEDAHLALEDFQTWIMEDVFLYHLSYICQMLNDISWGIHDYLLPEYQRAYRIDEDYSRVMSAQMYFFDVPASISSELGRIYYWNIMNAIRARPFIDRFKADEHLVGRY